MPSLMIYFQGTVLANKVGRRWTHSTLLGINALTFGIVMVMVPYQVCYVVSDNLNKFFFSSVHWLWRLHRHPSAVHDPQDEHLRYICRCLHSGKFSHCRYCLVIVLLLYYWCVFLVFILTRRQWRCSQPQCDNLGLAFALSSHRWSALVDLMPWLLEPSTLWYADHDDALDELDEVDCDEGRWPALETGSCYGCWNCQCHS